MLRWDKEAQKVCMVCLMRWGEDHVIKFARFWFSFFGRHIAQGALGVWRGIGIITTISDGLYTAPTVQISLSAT